MVHTSSWLPASVLLWDGAQVALLALWRNGFPGWYRSGADKAIVCDELVAIPVLLLPQIKGVLGGRPPLIIGHGSACFLKDGQHPRRTVVDSQYRQVEVLH